jgi:hypothetical protein
VFEYKADVKYHGSENRDKLVGLMKRVELYEKLREG